MPKTNKFINITVLTVFIAVAVFGVVAITPSHHQPGCPFMPGEQAICPMGLFEHISAWKNIFTVSIPAIFIILIFAALLNFAFWLFHLPPRLPVVFRRLKIKNFFYNNLYQELFSQGILNPKAP